MSYLLYDFLTFVEISSSFSCRFQANIFHNTFIFFWLIMHAQESISLVFDLKSVFGFSLEIIFVSFLGSSFLLKSKSYGLANNRFYLQVLMVTICQHYLSSGSSQRLDLFIQMLLPFSRVFW